MRNQFDTEPTWKETFQLMRPRARLRKWLDNGIFHPVILGLIIALFAIPGVREIALLNLLVIGVGVAAFAWKNRDTIGGINRDWFPWNNEPFFLEKKSQLDTKRRVANTAIIIGVVAAVGDLVLDAFFPGASLLIPVGLFAAGLAAETVPFILTTVKYYELRKEWMQSLREYKAAKNPLQAILASKPKVGHHDPMPLRTYGPLFSFPKAPSPSLQLDPLVPKELQASMQQKFDTTDSPHKNFPRVNGTYNLHLRSGVTVEYKYHNGRVLSGNDLIIKYPQLSFEDKQAYALTTILHSVCGMVDPVSPEGLISLDGMSSLAISGSKEMASITALFCEAIGCPYNSRVNITSDPKLTKEARASLKEQGLLVEKKDSTGKRHLYLNKHKLDIAPMKQITVSRVEGISPSSSRSAPAA